MFKIISSIYDGILYIALVIILFMLVALIVAHKKFTMVHV